MLKGASDVKTIRLLYFSVNRWGNMGRRKPRMAHELARYPEVGSILYVEPAVETSFLDLTLGRLDGEHLEATRAAHLGAVLGRPRRVEEKIWAYTGSAKSMPLTRFLVVRRLQALHRLNQGLYYGGIRRVLSRLPGDETILWLSHPVHSSALTAFPERTLACYDWTDDWSAFDVLSTEEPQQTATLNDQILEQADLVFAVSVHLKQRAAAVNANTYHVPNATDVDILSGVLEEGPVAAELAELTGPVIGYVGTVSDKIDYGFVDQMARLRPSWNFVFVGPVWSRHQEQVGALETLGNVHFLGPRPFEQLVPYLRGFDVCMLPHAVNRLTRSMDPIKMYDYLNTGKPIVSTPVAGIERFADVVAVAQTPAGFIDRIEAGLTEDGAKAQERLERAKENTWRHRAARVWSIIQDALSSEPRKLQVGRSAVIRPD